jgi:hypothetical protein
MMRTTIAVFLFASLATRAAEIGVTRRGFLIGSGATLVTAVAPKKILTPTLAVSEGMSNAWLFSANPGPPTVTIFHQILQHAPYLMRQLSPELSDDAIGSEVDKLRSIWETKGLILPRRWEPIALQERSGGWFEGFGRALSRKNFLFLSDLMEAKKGEVSPAEVQRLIEADGPVCDANLNTPLLDQPVYIQEDEN